MYWKKPCHVFCRLRKTAALLANVFRAAADDGGCSHLWCKYQEVYEHLSGMLAVKRLTVAVKRPTGAASTEEENKSDITPDPGWHRPQRPCAQGRTCA